MRVEINYAFFFLRENHGTLLAKKREKKRHMWILSKGSLSHGSGVVQRAVTWEQGDLSSNQTSSAYSMTLRIITTFSKLLFFISKIIITTATSSTVGTNNCLTELL